MQDTFFCFFVTDICLEFSTAKLLKHLNFLNLPNKHHMQKIVSLLIIVFFSTSIFAQEAKLYNPMADADSAIKVCVKKAKAEGKYVILQGGGNWCSWCIEFHRFCLADKKIDSTIKASFVWYELNMSKENENKKIFARYGYPGHRFGYPVFIILDEKGKLIHIQNSEYLEDGKKSYNRDKVQSFLEAWTPKAMDPKTYGD